LIRALPVAGRTSSVLDNASGVLILRAFQKI
jgi:hypothetical protein